MPILGNLKEIPLVTLLEPVAREEKTGVFAIDRAGETAHLYLRAGIVTHVQVSGGEDFTTLLLREGAVPQEYLEEARALQGERQSDKRLALLLVDLGYIEQSLIINLLTTQTEVFLRYLLDWPEGECSFTEDVTPPDEKIPVVLPFDQILAMGQDNGKEWDRIKDRLPDLHTPITFADIHEENLAEELEVKLTPDEWRVLARLNPTETIYGIADSLGWSTTATCKIVYNLLETELLALGSDEPADPLLDNRLLRKPGKTSPVTQFPQQSSGEGRASFFRFFDRWRNN